MSSRRRRRDGALDRGGEWLVYAVGRAGGYAARGLGLWRACRLAHALGGRLIAALPGPRRRLHDNLARVYPEMPATERRRLAREAAGHFARLCIEYVNLDLFVRDLRLSVSGMGHLDRPRAEGRGVLIVTAHYANWEALRLACQRAGHECAIIYRAFNNRYVDRFTLRLIGLCGEPVLQKGPAGLRALTSHLKAGGVALVLVDQRTTGAPRLDFLGHPAETLTVAASLARRTGAALVPARARRGPEDGRFEVAIEPAVPEGEPEAMMAAVNARISAWIAEAPEQWFWLHRRWRTRTPKHTRRR
ncbi:MAG: lysophospholipid acyltransferase family protein [Paracoccaceae bacterium]